MRSIDALTDPTSCWEPGLGVHVRAPGSSANIGPGFDSIGLALGLWDDYTATVTESGLQILIDGEAAFTLPRDGRHLVYRSMVTAWSRLGVGEPPGLQLVCRNGIPQSRGLGSSATAVVAGVLVAQALHRLATGGSSDVDRTVTNAIAGALEGHPDNASASIYGGMTLSWYDGADDRTHPADPVHTGAASASGSSGSARRSSGPGHPLRTVRLDLDAAIVPVVLLPTHTLSTSLAREVLPALVPHAEAALNAARAALLVEAVTRRPDLLLPATRDWLHQEQRRASFPASMALVDRLRATGHAAVISGAGPSVLVLATHDRQLEVDALAPAGEWRVLRPGIPAAGATVEAVAST